MSTPSVRHRITITDDNDSPVAVHESDSFLGCCAMILQNAVEVDLEHNMCIEPTLDALRILADAFDHGQTEAKALAGDMMDTFTFTWSQL